jgi:Arc/MetJ-type ribon-helix-helix transcriptional regulator
MNVTLKGNIKDFVNKKVEDGLYENADDFVRDAIRKFDQSDPSLGVYNKHNEKGYSGNFNGLLGDLNSGDIEALAFIVLQQATKSAQDDLKSIMEGIKRINQAKDAFRSVMEKIDIDIKANEGQKKKHPPLDFSQGMGNEAAYHHILMPVAVKDSKGEVEFIITNLYDGSIDDIDKLSAIIEKIKGHLDEMSQMGEMTSLRLQMIMDRRSKFISTLSNLMKKISSTQESLVQNIK